MKQQRLALIITLNSNDDAPLLIDGLNDFLRSDDVYPLIADSDDYGWEYLTVGTVE